MRVSGVLVDAEVGISARRGDPAKRRYIGRPLLPFERHRLVQWVVFMFLWPLQVLPACVSARG